VTKDSKTSLKNNVM